MKHFKWLVGNIFILGLIALAASVQAVQPTPLAQLALQPSDLPTGSQVLSQGAFTPDTPLAGGGYRMVNEKGEPWVQGYVAGYQLQARALAGAAQVPIVVIHYIHRFPSVATAQAEYARWQTQLTNFKPVAMPSPLPSALGFAGLQFFTTDPEIPAVWQWGLGQKGDVLWLLMVEELRSFAGVQATQPSAEVTAFFAALTAQLAQR